MWRVKLEGEEKKRNREIQGVKGVDGNGLGLMPPVAPEAVWQVGRPPYQSEIWYGGAIPIGDAGISLVLISTNSLLHYLFHSTSLPITFTNRHLNSAYYLLTDLGLHICCCKGNGGKRPILTLCDCKTDSVQAVLHLLEYTSNTFLR